MTRLSRVLSCLTLAAASAARANGAFPDSQGLFAPADEPQRFLLTTNFGLIESVDDGQTWHIICEISALAPNAYLYEMGPGPDHRILALSFNGLSFSDNDACSWAITDGGIPALSIVDAYTDPSDGTHVFAVASVPTPDGGLPPPSIYESHTGGASFSPTPLYTAPPTSYITGVEVSASNPSRIYATMYITQPVFRPFVVRSDDRGASWIENELTGPLGNTTLRLVAVDPTNPDVVYLRLIDKNGLEGVGIASDAGAMAVDALNFDVGNRMTAFLRREDGSLLTCKGPDGGCFASSNGGGTWQLTLATQHVRALAERDGGLFVAAANYQDGYAVGLALDDGGIQSLLTYQAIAGLKGCGAIPGLCHDWWISTQKILNPPLRGDAGAHDGGASDAGPKKGGCQCGDAGLPGALVAAALLGLGLLSGRRRARAT